MKVKGCSLRTAEIAEGSVGNMKASRFFIRLIKIAFCSILLLGVLIPTATFVYNKVVSGSRHVATEYFNLDYVFVRLNHFYARAVSHDISTCIADYTKQHTLFSFNSHQLYSLLKGRCKLIKDFDCHVHVPKSVDVQVTGVQPYCIINNTFILGNKRRLFGYQDFVNADQATLHQVTLHPKLCGSKLPQNVFDFLHKIPLFRWQTFNIAYHSPSHIELTPKAASCPCTVIVDQATFFDDAKLKEIGNVFDNMVKRGFLLQKTLMAHDRRVTFDLRFDRRVVVRCKDGFNKRGTGL